MVTSLCTEVLASFQRAHINDPCISAPQVMPDAIGENRRRFPVETRRNHVHGTDFNAHTSQYCL